nr:MAG TPA: hypothetical protein [Caudoviricetes sp.]
MHRWSVPRVTALVGCGWVGVCYDGVTSQRGRSYR